VVVPAVAVAELARAIDTTRPTASSGFAAPQPLALNTLANEVAASLSADGSSMILISDAMGGIAHIMRSERVGGDYQPVELLDPVLVGATGDETDPTLTPDGTAIVFVSNRVGGMGGYDVYYAERTCQ